MNSWLGRMKMSAYLAFKSLIYLVIKRSFSYSRNCRQLQKIEFSDDAALQLFQTERLTSILTAAQQCRFYREHCPESTNLEDYPIIDKAIVREDVEGFINPTYRGASVSGGTSGTTGAPLKLKKGLEELRWEEAHVNRQLQWMGCSWREASVWIRGDMVVPAGVDQAPFWVRNYVTNTLMMSSYHLSDLSAKEYIGALEKFDPVYIQAYPSSIRFLASYMLATGRVYQGQRLKGILTSSESLTSIVQGQVEKAFSVRVFDWYGSYERVAAIGTCEKGVRHLISDYSLVELEAVDDDRYEIIGTSFANHLMPLVRYRTGDYVSGIQDAPCTCGRLFPVVGEVLGRCDDSIRTPSGKSIGRLDHIFKDTAGICEAQIIQHQLDEVIIRVVPAGDFRDEYGERIANSLRVRVGEEMKIVVEQVSSLPRTKNGKLKMVVSTLDQ